MSDTPRDPAALAAIQAILDRSAATATPEVGAVFARDDWRLPAAEFLDLWKENRWVVVSSVGSKGQPHSAVVHAEFDGADLKMWVFDQSIRARDLQSNPRVSLVKYSPEGVVMTVYGRASRIEGASRALNTAGGGGRTINQYLIDVTRIYAMRPGR